MNPTKTCLADCVRRVWRSLDTFHTPSYFGSLLKALSLNRASGVRNFWRRLNQQGQSFWLRYQGWLLLLIFFLVWHPIVHSRYVPLKTPGPATRAQIIPIRTPLSPTEKISLIIEISAQFPHTGMLKIGGLKLKRNNKEIHFLPITIGGSLPKGEYYVAAFAEDNKGRYATALLENSSGSSIPMKSKGVAVIQPLFIEVDEDFWELIYPCLRRNTAVHIR